MEFLEFRFDIGLDIILVIFLISYFAFLYLSKNKTYKKFKYIICFLLGIFLLNIASDSYIGINDDRFSIHMIQHTIVMMIAPYFITLSNYSSLFLNVLNKYIKNRDLMRLIIKMLNICIKPIIVLLLFSISLFALYFTSWYLKLEDNNLLHTFTHLHLFMVGYLWYLSIIGDRKFIKIPTLYRILVTFITIPIHTIFSLTIMNSNRIIGKNYFHGNNALNLQLHDQYIGGSIAWFSGDIISILIFIRLIYLWYCESKLECERIDRRLSKGSVL